MLMVRQPIPPAARITLGVLSIVILMIGYTWLAHERQDRKRQLAGERLERVEQRLQDLRSSSQAEIEPGRTREAELERLEEQAAQLAEQKLSAIDRTIPTWTSLYRDGLLRVLTPQGLRQDEYWLWEDATATLGRLVKGLSVGILLSVITGLLMGSYTPVESFLFPPLSFLAKIPPTAMLAVFFVLVGTDEEMYVTMIAFGTLPILAQTIYQSVKSDVPASLVFKAYTLGANHAELIWNVILRQILPRVIDAARLQIGPAMVLLVAAEWMVAGEGFGYRLRLFYQRTDMTVVYLYLIILGIIGLSADYLFTWTRRWLCPWFGQ